MVVLLPKYFLSYETSNLYLSISVNELAGQLQDLKFLQFVFANPSKQRQRCQQKQNRGRNGENKTEPWTGRATERTAERMRETENGATEIDISIH